MRVVGMLMAVEHAVEPIEASIWTCTPPRSCAPGSEYPPIATEHRMKAGNAITVTGQGGTITALPLLQEHGDIPSHAFRFGKFAYSCDLSGMPAETAEALTALDVWVVDALRYRPHPSHFSVADALSWIERAQAETRDSDQPARRPGLRRSAQGIAATC